MRCYNRHNRTRMLRSWRLLRVIHNSAASLCAKYGIPQVHRSYAALIADPTIDAIYNPLPNSLHGEWSIQRIACRQTSALRKTTGANATEAAAMATVAAERNLLLMEAFHTLYHPLAARMKTIVRQR